jgi:hypothetical protein
MPGHVRFLGSLAVLSLVIGCSESSDNDETGAMAGSAPTAGQSSGGQNGTGGRNGTNGGRNGNDGGRNPGSSGSSTMGTAGSTTGTAGSGNTNDMYGDARIRCVDRTNALRATKGLGPIPRLAKAEPCVDGQAKKDSETGEAHSAFDDCLDQVKWKGAGQNECPGYGSVESALGGCLDAMWAEGPGGGHYDNMVGNSTHTACGFYTTPQGKVWMIQDFWTE